ncbi:5-oxoprolinase subunit PxpA [Psychromonas sp. MME2]|uniref:5-oxoprolinase subunit PxpA n=1 Tax=Psychromonas sp. MME2 TaxID=3231033 RepID=UPI00339C39E7
MKLNCDMGESYGAWNMGADAQVMPYIDQANIACGFHAGDPDVMSVTIALAKQYQVQIGAHPAYHDMQGFGRRSIAHSPAQITRLICYQVGALDALCALHGTQLAYVKPHGALYNDMMVDIGLFSAIIDALASFKQPLALMILARPDLQAYQKIAASAGVTLLYEAFADRAYDDQGYLLSRKEPGALLSDPALIKKQVQLLIDEQRVISVSGESIKLPVDTICVHGDNPVAIHLISELRQLIINR